MASSQTGRSTGVQDNEASLRTRFVFWLIKRRLGRVLTAHRIRARDPKLLELALRIDAHNAFAGIVPRKLKELAQLKVAMMVGCPG